MTSRQRLVVVGNGMIAASLLQDIMNGRGGELFDITVFGAESRPAYDRIKLSSLLAGECDEDALNLLPPSWYTQHGVALQTGCPVSSIDRKRRVVRDGTGAETPYDVCVIATGSRPLMPRIEGAHRSGVHVFRTLEDVRAIIAGATACQRAVVVGGGLLGLEAAHGLRSRGLDVAVVHLMDRLMERQLDAVGARVLRSHLEERGLSVHLSAQTHALLGNGHVEGVSLRDQGVLDADMVVIACGVAPATELASSSGLEVRRGICVDDGLRTSDPHVYAIGECSEHRGLTYGIVAPLRIQAQVLARRLLGDETAVFEGGVNATTLKVAGVHVFSAGAVDAEQSDDILTLEDSGGGVYKKVILRKDKIRGAVFVGDLATAPAIMATMSGATLSGDRLALVAPPPSVSQQSTAFHLADEAVVCGCNGVTKATIVAAVAQRGCSSRAEVTKCTRAAGSCGSCGPLVDALLSSSVATAAATSATPVEPSFCTCLPLPRRVVREEVTNRGLRSVGDVLAALGNGVGCARCKPALSYLLDVTWCGEYQEDRSARFINDRVHANIQNDGTFSVVPRMLGGVTTPSELRRIADVAERFAVPMVKVTGGQRIDLLGVRKEDLPAMWAQLGMPSGHAYAKAVRTVKTCVGSDFCRFGVGDSTALGMALERVLSGLYTPHKFKSGVTGCPRNCAEITVKDLGVMAIATGWEIYVGGAAGMTVRKADLLSTVPTAEEALRHCVLFVQHYREEADYLERTYHFLSRVGIEAVRRATTQAPPHVQEALWERFWRARSKVVDPWAAEGTSPRTALQFGAPASSAGAPAQSGDGEQAARDGDPAERSRRLLAALPVC
ncbi:MAG TPA: nitrite reductase large subunit NirB [Candidatus Sulfotelmatobacter sp.]|nr:nitrite reductase large subunit NirB [Candidatus Sulfotelmatobacter sp.]